MNALKTKQHTIYDLMNELGIIESMRNYFYACYETAESLPLHADLLNRENDRILCALAHNRIRNDDILCEPDMEILIDLKNHTVQPLTYRNDSEGIFEQIYDCDESTPVNESLKRELSVYLEEWLRSLIRLNYKLSERKN
ncbi:MAG: hypothetical protein JW982_14890 [Spirochaetes bacterium]|nr:hypothetical protein [Spirochaetota bacterium]